MSIVESGKIDAIGLEPSSGEVVLTISDHLDWSDTKNHLLTLQEKINNYIEFIESEQIILSYPEAIGRSVRIEIISKYQYPEEGVTFLEKVKPILDSVGVQLSRKLLSR